MNLQEKLKELNTQLETANKKHIDAKAEIITVTRNIKVLKALIEKANEILNPNDSKEKV